MVISIYGNKIKSGYLYMLTLYLNKTRNHGITKYISDYIMMIIK